MPLYRSDLVCEIALSAVQTVAIDKDGGRKEIDIKRYARVEMIPGGTIEDSEVLCGVMLNKDVTHPRMKRYVCAPMCIHNCLHSSLCIKNCSCYDVHVGVLKILELFCWTVHWSTRREKARSVQIVEY